MFVNRFRGRENESRSNSRSLDRMNYFDRKRRIYETIDRRLIDKTVQILQKLLNHVQSITDDQQLINIAFECLILAQHLADFSSMLTIIESIQSKSHQNRHINLTLRQYEAKCYLHFKKKQQYDCQGHHMLQNKDNGQDSPTKRQLPPKSPSKYQSHRLRDKSSKNTIKGMENAKIGSKQINKKTTILDKSPSQISEGLFELKDYLIQTQSEQRSIILIQQLLGDLKLLRSELKQAMEIYYRILEKYGSSQDNYALNRLRIIDKLIDCRRMCSQDSRELQIERNKIQQAHRGKIQTKILQKLQWNTNQTPRLLSSVMNPLTTSQSDSSVDIHPILFSANTTRKCSAQIAYSLFKSAKIANHSASFIQIFVKALYDQCKYEMAIDVLKTYLRQHKKPQFEILLIKMLVRAFRKSQAEKIFRALFPNKQQQFEDFVNRIQILAINQSFSGPNIRLETRQIIQSQLPSIKQLPLSQSLRQVIDGIADQQSRMTSMATTLHIPFLRRLFDNWEANQFSFDSLNQTAAICFEMVGLVHNDQNAFEYHIYYYVTQQLKKGVSLQKVNQQLKTKLDELAQNYPPSTNQPLSLEHSTIFELSNIQQVDLCNGSPIHSLSTLKAVIQKIVVQGQIILYKFQKLQEPLTKQLKGSDFVANTKLEGISEYRLLRIYEKLFEEQFKQMKSQLDTIQTDPLKLSTFMTSVWQRLNSIIEDILKSKNGQIKCTITDFVRGKCQFINASLIGHAFKWLKQHYTIIDFKDRLSLPTRDIKLIISIDGFPCQLQLALVYSAEANKFNHRIYQLRRALFGPATQALLWADDQKRYGYLSVASMPFNWAVKTQHEYLYKFLYKDSVEMVYCQQRLLLHNIRVSQNSIQCQIQNMKTGAFYQRQAKPARFSVIITKGWIGMKENHYGIVRTLVGDKYLLHNADRGVHLGNQQPTQGKPIQFKELPYSQPEDYPKTILKYQRRQKKIRQIIQNGK